MTYQDDFRRAERDAPWVIGKVFKWFVILSVLGIGFGFVGNALGWFGKAQQVVVEEFSPREMLRKYEWFKDAAAQLDKKQADIHLYAKRFAAMDGNRSTWDRTDKETWAQWQAELLGVTASYNSLAAEYNAQMAKFNWRFAERGRLPAGASEPLPREFKPYESGE